jgi:uncharacterized protein
MLRTMQAVAVLVAFIPAVALGQGKVTSGDKIKVDVKADKAAGATRSVTVKLEIEKGWHVYANPVGDELLEDGATKLTFLADGKAVEAKVEYPKGKTVTLGPDRYNVYEDSVTIKATVPAGASKVRVKVQACNDETKKCLLPGNVTVDVP